ncbi:MAG: peptidyl-prolyl cis-trans isomerase [Candidatus Omnitrophota bacterium]
MVKVKILRIILLLASIAICDMRYAICDLFAQDKIIAIVNSEVITQKDLDDFLKFLRLQLEAQYKGKELEDKIQSMKLDILDKLVEDRLILMEAKLNNIRADEARVKARIDDIRKRYPTDSGFQHALSSQGITLADIEAKIREQILMYNIVDLKVQGKIRVNPSEVTDFYQKHSTELAIPEEREFQAVATDKKELAEKMCQELKGGCDLKDTSDRLSTSFETLSAQKTGELNPEIEEALFKLRSGEASSPIKIQETYYILRLDKIIPPRQPTLLESQEKIYDLLLERKMQESLSKWLDELRDKSYIKVLQD